jgi:large subunit ribosomal protein L30
MSTYRITQVRSTIGRTQDQRAMVRTLGLKRIHQTVTQPDRPEIRGILNRIPHLVEWELVDDDSAPEADTTAAPEADTTES